MRDIIGLIVGLYLTVALVVFGGAAYSFMSGDNAKYSSCARPADLRVDANLSPELEGGPNWVPWALYRGAIWPKTFFDDIDKTDGVIGWLLVQYNPFAGTCR